MTRLVIVVSGGAVQELYANDTLLVHLLDYDDLDACSDPSAFQSTRERTEGHWEPSVVGEGDLDRLVREFKEELTTKEAAITKESEGRKT